jgi:hypothetical protein
MITSWIDRQLKLSFRIAVESCSLIGRVFSLAIACSSNLVIQISLGIVNLV